MSSAFLDFLELNGLAVENLNLVIKNHKNVKVETIAELKDLVKTVYNMEADVFFLRWLCRAQEPLFMILELFLCTNENTNGSVFQLILFSFYLSDIKTNFSTVFFADDTVVYTQGSVLIFFFKWIPRNRKWNPLGTTHYMMVFH